MKVNPELLKVACINLNVWAWAVHYHLFQISVLLAWLPKVVRITFTKGFHFSIYSFLDLGK